MKTRREWQAIAAEYYSLSHTASALWTLKGTGPKNCSLIIYSPSFHFKWLSVPCGTQKNSSCEWGSCITSSLDIVLNISYGVPCKSDGWWNYDRTLIFVWTTPLTPGSLSTSLLHHLQGPLDFRSTSPPQPIILYPWPVRLLSAKPLCRDFLPGSLIVTQIHPVVFLFKDFECIYFSAGGS